MTTIANVVVSASVDPNGVRSGLDQAARYTQEYMRKITISAEQDRSVWARSAGSVSTYNTEILKLSKELRSAADAELNLGQRLGSTTSATSGATTAAKGLAQASTAAGRAMAMQEIAAYKMDAAMMASVTSTTSLATAEASLGAMAMKTVGLLAAIGVVAEAKSIQGAGARYETLGVVMDVVGRNAGYSASKMAIFEQGLERTGISMIQSRQNLARMTSAQLDLNRATDLGRVAQNAAVIADINSSEAFERLINGITTGQPRVLRTMGIFVDFKRAQQEWADQHGRTVASMTPVEKEQARLNAVIQFGTHIAGAYEASMATVGKELKSTERYLENVKVKVGTVFLPEEAHLVKMYADGLKALGDNAHLVIGAIDGVGVAVSVLLVAWKADSIMGGIILLANPVVAGGLLAAATILGEIAIIFGAAAADAALLRRDTAEWSETLKHLPQQALARNINQSSARIADLRSQLPEHTYTNPFNAGDTHLDKQGQAIVAEINDLVAKRHQYVSALTAAAQKVVVAKDPLSEVDDKRGPYADLKDRIGELTTAYESMRSSGIAPTVELQSKLEEELQRTGRMLDQLKDKTGPAANALRAIQKDILNSGLHANDAALPGGRAVQFTLPTGKEDTAVASLTARLGLLRSNASEFSLELMGAESQLRHMLDGVDAKIEMEGGLLRASNSLLEARSQITKELADQQKSQGKELWSSEDALQLSESVKAGLAALKISLKDNNDEWSSMKQGIHGVIDAASGLNAIPHSLSQAATSAVHLVDTFKQLKKLQAAGGSGLDSAAGLATMVGGIGAVISIVGSIASIFQHEDAAAKAREAMEAEHLTLLRDNTAKLADLSLSLANSGGMNSQREFIRELSVIRQEILRIGPDAKIGIQGTAQYGQFTWDQILALAKQNGIALVDANGYTDPKLIQQFIDYLTEAGKAALSFSQSILADQRTVMDLHRHAYGQTGAADVINEDIALLRKFAPQLASTLDGIDASTAEGRAKLRKAVQDFVALIEQNLITSEQLGGLSGVKEFASILDNLLSGLDTLGNAANSAASSVANLPAWYKVDALRWRSADASNPISTPPVGGGPRGTPIDAGGTAIFRDTIAVVTTDLDSFSSAVRAATSAMIPDVASGVSRTGSRTSPIDAGGGAPVQAVNIYGDIRIDGSNLSPEEMFLAVARFGQARAHSLFSNSTRIADAMASVT